jgi:hypothetical protein
MLSKLRACFFNIGNYFHIPTEPLNGSIPESASIPEPDTTKMA